MVRDVLVQSRRDKRPAKRLLCRLLKQQCQAPRVQVTDKLGSYGAAKEKLLRHRLRLLYRAPPFCPVPGRNKYQPGPPRQFL
jgi:transposase-like protein